MTTLTLDSPTEDSPGYSNAIAKSLAEAGRSKQVDNTAMSPSTGTMTTADETPKSPPSNLDDIIKNMAVKMGLEVPRINVTDGDTWIFIDPPSQQPEQDNESYNRYVERSHTPIVMNSATLFALNSSFFEKAMGPTAQHRVLRRRGLVGKLPPRIKYVLDLTPPSEGDEAVYLMSELYCSEGVTKWIIAGRLWRISKNLIGGQEEYLSRDSVASEASVQIMKAEIHRSEATQAEKQHQLLQLEESLLPIPLPYTPLRHRSAIERVLLAISGCDPELNSAPKVWTACAVAKYFEIKTPFDDYVVRWLRADPNHHFLDVLPEVSLKIADGLQCHDLCRDAFAILVGEEAIGSLYRSRPELSRSEIIRGTTTVHGRKKEDMPEVYQTRIEYASKALVERVAGEFMKIVSVDWMEELPEMKKTTLNMQPTVGPCVVSLKTCLKAYIRGAVYRALCANYRLSGMFRPDFDYSKTNGLFPMTNKIQVWNGLLPRERLLTRSFWDAFSVQRLFAGPTNVNIAGEYTDSVPLEEESDAELALRRDGVVEVVTMAELYAQAALYQRLCHPHNHTRPMLRLDAAASAPQTGDMSVLSDPHDNTPPQRFLNSDPIHWDPFRRATDAVPGMSSGLGANTAPQPILFRGRPLSFDEHVKVCVFMKSWVSGDKDRLSEALQFPYEWYDSHEASGIDTGIYAEEAPQLDSWDDWTESWLRAYGEGVGAFHRPYDRFHGAFSLMRFFEQATAYLQNVAGRMLAPTDASIRAGTHPLGLSEVLVSLEDSEFKYLPLWAGGCDDGSGGVYDDDVPIATSGFSHPGPNVHLGSGSSAASSEFDFIRGAHSHNTSTLTLGFSQGVSSGSVRSVSENGNDPFVDAEGVRAPSTLEDSEYDFGSTTSVGVGTTAERLARFGLGPDMQQSEKAKGKMAVRDNIVEAAVTHLMSKEQELADLEKSEEVKEEKPVVDDDFDSIFDDDDDMGADDGEDDFDEGNDSDDTIGEAKDSDDDIVMV